MAPVTVLYPTSVDAGPRRAPDGNSLTFQQQGDAGLASFTITGHLAGHVGTVYCAAFSPDGSRMATGGNDATVRLWDARTGEDLLVLRGHEQYVMDLAFTPDGTRLASASDDATIRLWDTKPLPERRALGGR